MLQKSPAKKCWSILDTLLSGSPIIENGKLVGAVTHVLVCDPTRGYGIFAENMLETAQAVAEQQELKMRFNVGTSVLGCPLLLLQTPL